MSVVIIGAGNVASVFGRLIKKAGHEIIQVVSRDTGHARLLANELGCSFAIDLKKLNTTADLYIVAISDAALNEIRGFYFPGDKLIVHTAGAVSKHILKMVSRYYGVMYPLQSLRKENPEIHPDIPLLIDGSSGEVISVIGQFASTISSTVTVADDEQRIKLHLAAVIVNNFTNYLYSLAADYCKKEGIDFKMLQPLIEETALRLRNHDPVDMQTGPAIRRDRITMDKHLDLLNQHPALKKIYRNMTACIIEAPTPDGL